MKSRMYGLSVLMLIVGLENLKKADVAPGELRVLHSDQSDEQNDGVFTLDKAGNNKRQALDDKKQKRQEGIQDSEGDSMLDEQTAENDHDDLDDIDIYMEMRADSLRGYRRFLI